MRKAVVVLVLLVSTTALPDAAASRSFEASYVGSGDTVLAPDLLGTGVNVGGILVELAPGETRVSAAAHDLAWGANAVSVYLCQDTDHNGWCGADGIMGFDRVAAGCGSATLADLVPGVPVYVWLSGPAGPAFGATGCAVPLHPTTGTIAVTVS